MGLGCRTTKAREFAVLVVNKMTDRRAIHDSVGEGKLAAASQLFDGSPAIKGEASRFHTGHWALSTMTENHCY